MGRGNDDASKGAAQGVQNSQTFGANSQGAYNTVMPAIQQGIAAPPGISPADLATMNTAAQESAGGSQAAAVGQGRLLAGRTRNPGSADAAIASAARSSGEALSDAALKTELANEKVKQQQRSQAIGEGTSLYAPGVSGSNQALGETANNVNANTQAENASWDWATDVFAPVLGAGAKVASAGLA